MNVNELRKMNKETRRTDVENLFLQEMVAEDQDEIINESDDIAFDTVIPDNTDTGLFGDASSESILDSLDTDDDVIEGFDITELF